MQYRLNAKYVKSSRTTQMLQSIARAKSLPSQSIGVIHLFCRNHLCWTRTGAGLAVQTRLILNQWFTSVIQFSCLQHTPVRERVRSF